MSSPTMRQRLAGGEVLLGVAQLFAAPGIVESLACGWDFIWIDGQHGQLDYQAMLGIERAAESQGLPTMLRVPTHDEGLLGLYADIGPSAVMVPMVNDAAEAGRIVRGLCFPPVGSRSYGGGRLVLLGGPDYFRQRDLLVVAQIETAAAVEAADAIAAVAGIDVLFFSPADMRVQMGIPLSTPVLEHAQSRAAMEKTARAARRAGKFAGTVVGAAPVAQAAVEMGYQLLGGGGDGAFLRGAAQARLAELRAALPGASRAATPR
jgi:4-hydroxy-2-oxoheptanedioate aldolase